MCQLGRFLYFAVIGIILVASLALVATTLWLRSAGGRLFLAHHLADWASQAIGRQVSIGRVAGSITRDLVLEEVEVDDGAGVKVGSVASLSLRYSLPGILGRNHAIDSLRAVRPSIDLRLLAATRNQGSGRQMSLRSINIVDGTAMWHNDSLGVTRIDHLSATGAARSGADNVIRLDEVAGTVDGPSGRRHLSAKGTIRWDRNRANLEGFEAALGQSRVRGRCRLGAKGRFDARSVDCEIDSLTLDAADTNRMFGKLEPATIVGHVSGTRERLTTAGTFEIERRIFHWNGELAAAEDALSIRRLDVRLGPSGIRVHGRIERDRIDVVVAPHLDPSSLHHLVAALEPASPLDGRLTLAGPRHALAVNGELRLAKSTVYMRGIVDIPERSMHTELTFDLDGRSIRPRDVELTTNGKMTVDAQLRAGGLLGTVAVERTRGRVAEFAFDDGTLDGHLAGGQLRVRRFGANIPGGRVVGSAQASFNGALQIRYNVHVTDAGELPHVGPWKSALISATNPFTSGAVLAGRVDRRPGERVDSSVGLVNRGNPSQQEAAPRRLSVTRGHQPPM